MRSITVHLLLKPQVQRLRTEEKLGATAIAERLGIGRVSVYRVLASNDQS